MVKILCLHGLRHSGTQMASSMKMMIKKLRKCDIHFDFCNSPIMYPEEGNTTLGQWWSSNRDNAMSITHYDTLDESIAHVMNIWNSGEYDGLLGFSQGSVLGQIIMHGIENGTIVTPFKPKFYLAFSPSLISDIEYQHLYDGRLKTRCMVFAGRKDTLVVSALSDVVAEKLGALGLSAYLHNGGHYVSGDAKLIKVVEEFIVETINLELYPR